MSSCCGCSLNLFHHNNPIMKEGAGLVHWTYPEAALERETFLQFCPAG